MHLTPLQPTQPLLHVLILLQANKGSSSYGSKSQGSDVPNSGGSEAGGGSVASHGDLKLRALASLSSSSQSVSQESKEEAGLSVPRTPGMVRSVSAEDVSSAKAETLSTKFKRKPFLKRQQCQEAAEESEHQTAAAPVSPAGTSEPPAPHPALPPATPPAKLAAGSSPLKEEAGGEAEQEAGPHRQPSLDPLCGLESVPLLYSSSGPRLSPPTLFRPLVSSLPTVRIIPDPLEAASPAVEEGVAAGEAVLGPAPLTSGQLYPGHQSPLLQAEVLTSDLSPSIA